MLLSYYGYMSTTHANNMYQLRNYKTTETKFSTNLGLLVVELNQKGGINACWSVSRVQDGATYCTKTKTFGKRIFSTIGDDLRLAAAAKWLGSAELAA